jgi:hypothetical protein
MDKVKPESLPLMGTPMPRDPKSPVPSEAEIAIDAAIPRDGVVLASLAVSLEEYLSRLGSLKGKVFSVRYRLEQWEKLSEEHLSSLSKLTLSEVPLDGLPPGASASVSISLYDTRLDAEFEALLFAIRSGLDVLARVIASHFKGATDNKSYRRLRELLARYPECASASQAVERAWSNWAEDLTERRDAAGHYIALSVKSVKQQTFRANDNTVSKNEVLVGIPERGTKRNPSIWWDPSGPFVGGASHPKTEVRYADGTTVEAHGIFDSTGSLIVRRDGPIPAPPPMIDGNHYARSVAECFNQHVAEVLQQFSPNKAG